MLEPDELQAASAARRIPEQPFKNPSRCRRDGPMKSPQRCTAERSKERSESGRNQREWDFGGLTARWTLVSVHNYGLGWRMLLLKNGKKLIYHNGWWHGSRTALYWLPDEKITIIALCNNDSKRIYSVKKLADLFGDYLQKWR